MKNKGVDGMSTEVSAKWIAPIIITIVVVYALILGGIHICNNSYKINHKGFFTDEFSHQSFHKIS